MNKSMRTLRRQDVNTEENRELVPLSNNNSLHASESLLQDVAMCLWEFFILFFLSIHPAVRSAMLDPREAPGGSQDLL